MSKKDNMSIWNSLQETDPKYTSKITFGSRNFSAIDAHYQIMRMTEHFGPIGKGWKFVTSHEVIDSMYIANVTVSWFDGEWHEYGPVTSCISLTRKTGQLDDEAPKKATTDALTKALSYIGISADVFLGKFDDNKYVNQMKKKFNGHIAHTVASVTKSINECKSLEQLDEYINSHKMNIRVDVGDEAADSLIEIYQTKKAELTGDNNG